MQRCKKPVDDSDTVFNYGIAAWEMLTDGWMPVDLTLRLELNEF